MTIKRKNYFNMVRMIVFASIFALLFVNLAQAAHNAGQPCYPYHTCVTSLTVSPSTKNMVNDQAANVDVSFTVEGNDGGTIQIFPINMNAVINGFNPPDDNLHGVELSLSGTPVAGSGSLSDLLTVGVSPPYPKTYTLTLYLKSVVYPRVGADDIRITAQYFDNEGTPSEFKEAHLYVNLASNFGPKCPLKTSNWEHCDIGGSWGWNKKGQYVYTCPSGTKQVSFACPSGAYEFYDIGCFYKGDSPECRDHVGSISSADECCFIRCEERSVDAQQVGQACGNCGTIDCVGNCINQGTCSSGTTQSQGCGNCGTQSRTCTNSCQWGSFGACTGEGVCSPGATQSQTQDCGGGSCGTQSRTRTCTSSCNLPDWSTITWGSCALKSGNECYTGTTTSCTLGAKTGTKECATSCSWGSCVVAFSCTGTTPSNAVLCTNDDNGLTADTSKLAVSSCTDSKKCEYICDTGYAPNSVGSDCIGGNAHVRATLNTNAWSGLLQREVTASPYGPIACTSGATTPSDSTNIKTGEYKLAYCSGGPENTDAPTISPSATQTLTVGSDITFTFNFNCKSGYGYDSGSNTCVVAFSCTSQPSNSVLCTDGPAPTANTAVTVSTSCSNTVMCDATCASGLVKSGNTCIASTGITLTATPLCSGSGSGTPSIRLDWTADPDTGGYMYYKCPGLGCTLVVDNGRRHPSITTYTYDFSRSESGTVYLFQIYPDDASKKSNIAQTTVPSCPICTGITPSNAVLCTGDDTGLTADTPKTVVASCGAPKCEYTCSAGFVKSGNTCVAQTFSCTSQPSNSVLCTDGPAPTVDTATTLATSCSSTAICDATCASGYVKSGNTCVAASCTSQPSNSVLCTDGPAPTVDTATTLATSCSSTAICDATCASGYLKRESSCVAAPVLTATSAGCIPGIGPAIDLSWTPVSIATYYYGYTCSGSGCIPSWWGGLSSSTSYRFSYSASDVGKLYRFQVTPNTGGGGNADAPPYMDPGLLSNIAEATVPNADCCVPTFGNKCGNKCGTVGCSGNCVGEGICVPGTNQDEACGTCQRRRTCNDNCGWGEWFIVSGNCPCATPGQKQCAGTPLTLYQTCSEICQWNTVGDCILRNGWSCSSSQGPREYRSYTCNPSYLIYEDPCQYQVTSFQSCPTRDATDSDNSPTAFTIPGIVTIYEPVCSGGQCSITSTTHKDSCSSFGILTELTEYGLQVFGSGSFAQQFLTINFKNCLDYESDYCFNGRFFRDAWRCTGAPGACVNISDIYIGTDSDGDGVDKECGDSFCDNTPTIINSNRTETETNCNDNLDNDCNGFKDCLDFNCIGSADCPPTCTVDADCRQYECVEEQCAGGQCFYTNRLSCDTADCPLGKYCELEGGNCKSPDESENVCLNCISDQTIGTWSWPLGIFEDAGKAYSTNLDVFTRLFDSNAGPCPASSCTKPASQTDCHCYDANNNVVSHKSALATSNCCGNDANEFYKPDYHGGECTNSVDDCVWSTGDAQGSDTGNAEYWCYKGKWNECADATIGKNAIGFQNQKSGVCCAGVVGNNAWTPSSLVKPENKYSCTDGIDNDCDGKIDLDDNDCIFDYSITNSGDITISQGASGSVTINAELLSGDTQSVSFSVEEWPPSGATYSFSQTSCNPTCSGVLTIVIPTTTSTGTYIVTVRARSSGMPDKTTDFNLIVTIPPPCNTVSDCPQDDCVTETCVNKKCVFKARNSCDSTECQAGKYCNFAGGDCKTPDESENVCLNCPQVSDQTPSPPLSWAWSPPKHEDAGKAYSTNLDVFTRLFDSDAGTCSQTSCTKPASQTDCHCYDANNNVVNHKTALTTGNCCGNTANEFFKPDYYAGECTSSVDDCVWSTGDTQASDSGNAEYWCYKHEWYECTDTSIISIGTKTGGVCCAGVFGDNAWTPFLLVKSENQYSCNDGLDNDCDGKIDSEDSDCGACMPTESTETSCADNIDNDCDTLTDCADNDCSSAPNCLPFDYQLSAGDIIIAQGSSGTDTITATLLSGTTQEVTFSVEGLPSGATYSFSQTSCNPTCSSVLTISIPLTTPTGEYTITVRATSPGIADETVTFKLNVVPAGAFTYGLSADDITVVKGSSGTDTITAILLSGTTQLISLSVEGLPADATPSFSINSCNPTCETILTIIIPDTTLTGIYTITVRGTSSGVPDVTTKFNLNVVECGVCQPDCTRSCDPDNKIDISCDGQNGCVFCNAIAKAACDNAKPGWIRDYVDTTDPDCPSGCTKDCENGCYVICGEGCPESKTQIPASVTCEKGTLVKVTRIVLYNGKPVKLVIAECG